MLEIIYEDNHIIVLNKPAGVLTQPSPEKSESLETEVKLWLKEKYQKPGAVYLHAVHRLDTPVSGLILFAKTSKALSRLQETFRRHELQKIYLAVLEGEFPDDEGILEDFLVHGDGIAKVSKKSDPLAKKSQLLYKVLRRTKELTLIEVMLKTGRYHQIRVQFSSRGFPIWGDKKYGSRKAYPFEGIALHHAKLELQHPVKDEWMLWSSSPQWNKEDCLKI